MLCSSDVGDHHRYSECLSSYMKTKKWMAWHLRYHQMTAVWWKKEERGVVVRHGTRRNLQLGDQDPRQTHIDHDGSPYVGVGRV